MAKLQVHLSKDGAKNGLPALAVKALREPLSLHLVVGVVELHKIEEDPRSEERIPTMRLIRIEEVAPGDAHVAELLLRDAVNHRLGEHVSQEDKDQAVEDIFVDEYEIDLETGEILLPPDEVERSPLDQQALFEEAFSAESDPDMADALKDLADAGINVKVTYNGNAIDFTQPQTGDPQEGKDNDGPSTLDQPQA